jgi:hypothetical protein
MKAGQHVKLIAITPDLIADGLKVGQSGTVRKSASGLLGVEFEGHSDSGRNAGLHAVVVNTRRDGQTIPVISLCEVAE